MLQSTIPNLLSFLTSLTVEVGGEGRRQALWKQIYNF